jgi:hypothetical protein
VNRQLNDVGDRGDVWYSYRLQSKLTSVRAIKHWFRIFYTFGFPVVPLEKLSNAIFVLASPGFNFLSTKYGFLLKPSATRFCTFGCTTPGSGQNKITRLAGMPTFLAADCAIFKDSGWAKIITAFVASSW